MYRILPSSLQLLIPTTATARLFSSDADALPLSDARGSNNACNTLRAFAPDRSLPHLHPLYLLSLLPPPFPPANSF
jgi:hypothetical protein